MVLTIGFAVADTA